MSLYEMITTAYFEYQSEIENHKTMLIEREGIIDKQNNLIEGSDSQIWIVNLRGSYMVSGNVHR